MQFACWIGVPFLFTLSLHGSAEASGAGHAPRWRHTVVAGPDWQPALGVLTDGLRLDAQGATLWVNDFGPLWRFRLDANGAVQLRSGQDAAQLPVSTQLLGDEAQADLLFAQVSSTPDLDLSCRLQKQHSNGSRGWQWSHPVNSLDVSPCLTALQLPSGAVAFADQHSVVSLGDEGQEQWSVPLTQIASDGMSVHRLIAAAGGRILVAGDMALADGRQFGVAVLNAQDGAVLQLHLLAPGVFTSTAAARVDAGAIELLSEGTASGSAAQFLLHVQLSADGALVLRQTALEPFPASRSIRAQAHDSGFAVVGGTAAAAEVRVYDGTAQRWRAGLSAGEFIAGAAIAVDGSGAVALAYRDRILRFSADGLALPNPVLPAAAPDLIQALRFAVDGHLWVHSSSKVHRFPEMRVSRYGPSAQPLSSTRISLPRLASAALPMHRSSDGSLRFLAALASTSAQQQDSALISRSINPSGAVEVAARIAWPNRRVRSVGALADSWVVLDSASDGFDWRLNAVALDGTPRWSRLVLEYSQLSCDQRQRCALLGPHTGLSQRIDLLDPQGQVIATQSRSESMDLLPVIDGEALLARGLVLTGKRSSSLLSLDSLPLNVLARSDDVSLLEARTPHGHWSLNEALLGWLPDGLDAHGFNQLLWSLPHSGSLRGLSNRHARLFAVKQAANSDADQVHQINPANGQLVRQFTLPAPLTQIQRGCAQSQIDGSASSSACIDAADEQMTWLLAYATPASRSALLATRAGLAPRLFELQGRATELLALPGDAVLVQEWTGSSAEDSMLQLSLYEAELFRDGME